MLFFLAEALSLIVGFTFSVNGQSVPGPKVQGLDYHSVEQRAFSPSGAYVEPATFEEVSQILVGLNFSQLGCSVEARRTNGHPEVRVQGNGLALTLNLPGPDGIGALHKGIGFDPRTGIRYMYLLFLYSSADGNEIGDAELKRLHVFYSPPTVGAITLETLAPNLVFARALGSTWAPRVGVRQVESRSLKCVSKSFWKVK